MLHFLIGLLSFAVGNYLLSVFGMSYSALAAAGIAIQIAHFIWVKNYWTSRPGKAALSSVWMLPARTIVFALGFWLPYLGGFVNSLW